MSNQTVNELENEVDSIFSELAEDPWIPGRLLVKLRRSVPPVGSFGLDLDRQAIASMEDTLKSLGCEGLESLYSLSGNLEAFGDSDSVLGVDGPDSDKALSFLLRFDPEAMSSSDALTLIQGRPEVSAACRDGYRYAFQQPGTAFGGQPWASIAVGLAQAWDLGASGAGIKVAFLDTGVNSTHPPIRGHIVSGMDFVDLGSTPPPFNWRWAGDFKQPDAQPDDDVGHGTKMAGLIGGDVVGMAPNCELLPVRVLARMEHQSDGRVTGYGSISDVIRGIDWAVSQGASILNMSFGFPTSTWAEREAVKRAFRKNCLLVGAIGNSGASGALQFPAAFSEVLSVGSVDVDLAVSAFSQRGDHLDLVAPGGKVSTVDSNGNREEVSGTSCAAAIVSGIAALVRSVRPNLTVARVIEVLCRSANRANRPGPFPSRDCGFGLIHAGAAVSAARSLP